MFPPKYCKDLMRRRPICLILFILLLLVGHFGLVLYNKDKEWWQDLKAKSMSRYAWPLERDGKTLLEAYHKGNLKIPPITTDNSSITLLPLCSERSLVMVLIKTRVEDRYNRDLLRRTWVADLHKEDQQHSFLLGQCRSDECKRQLESELGEHQDIVQGDFIDAYHKKFRMGLKFIQNHCNKNNYILIIDGDYSLNAKRLLEYLFYLNYPKNLYAGQLCDGLRPERDSAQPRYLSYDLYPYRFLPPFIAAGATLLSTDIVESLNFLAQYTKYIPLEDVYYGMVAGKLKIPLVNTTHLLPSLYTPKVDAIDIHRFIVGSHRHGRLAEIERIHGIIHS